MTTNEDIRYRFVQCIESITDTKRAISQKVGCPAAYFNQVKNQKNPSIPVKHIANLCLNYHFNPAYIILGQGQMKSPDPKSKEEKWEAEREKYLDLIGKLLEGLIELKASFNDPLSQLVNEAGKKINKQ